MKMTHFKFKHLIFKFIGMVKQSVLHTNLNCGSDKEKNGNQQNVPSAHKWLIITNHFKIQTNQSKSLNLRTASKND